MVARGRWLNRTNQSFTDYRGVRDLNYTNRPTRQNRTAAVHGCEFRRRLAARLSVERDARRTRRRDACATARFLDSPHSFFRPHWDLLPTSAPFRPQTPLP